MQTILIVLTLTAITMFAVPLAILRAGIRRQERTGSLTCEPSKLSSVLTRRVLGLYAQLDEVGSRRPGDESAPLPVPNAEEARQS